MKEYKFQYNIDGKPQGAVSVEAEHPWEAIEQFNGWVAAQGLDGVSFTVEEVEQ